MSALSLTNRASSHALMPRRYALARLFVGRA